MKFIRFLSYLFITLSLQGLSCSKGSSSPTPDDETVEFSKNWISQDGIATSHIEAGHFFEFGGVISSPQGEDFIGNLSVSVVFKPSSEKFELLEKTIEINHGGKKTFSYNRIFPHFTDNKAVLRAVLKDQSGSDVKSLSININVY